MILTSKRRCRRAGIILASCLGLALADSSTLIRGGKLPPPPPPPPPSPMAANKSKQASSSIELSPPNSATQQLPPPPPRPHSEAQQKCRPPPPNHGSVTLDTIKSSKLQTSPPPPKRSMQLSPEPKEAIGNFPRVDSEEKQDAQEEFPSNVAVTLQVVQEDKNSSQVRDSKPGPWSKPERPIVLNRIEGLRLTEKGTKEEKEKSAVRPSHQLPTSADQTNRKASPAHRSSSDGRSIPKNDWSRKNAEVSFQAKSVPIPPVKVTSSSDPRIIYVERPQNPPARTSLPQDPPQQHQSGMPTGPQRSAPLQQNHGYQQPSQYGLPPNQHRVPPRDMQQYPQQALASSSTWKSLWGRVENGLDQLVNLEGSITGRAQQLMSSVAPTSLIRSTRQEQGSPSTSSAAGRHGAGHVNAQSVSRRPPQTSQRKSPGPTSATLAPYGQKYEIAKQKESQTQAKASGRQVDWTDLQAGKKMIRANGGASAPNGQNPSPPLMTSASQNSQHKPPPPQQQQAQHATQQAPASQSNNKGPLGGNPYTQPRRVQAAPIKPADPHSRASRIPWDSSKPSAPVAKKAAPPPMAEYDIEEKSWKSRLSKLVPPVPRLPSLGRVFRFRKGSSYQYASLDAWNNEDEEDQGGGLFGFFRRGPKERPAPSQISSPPAVKNGDAIATPLASMMARCHNGKSVSLLALSDEKRCRSIGRYQASFDIVSVIFILLGIQQLAGRESLSLPMTLLELTSTTLPALATVFRDSLQTWAPFAFAYAYLAMTSRNVLFRPRVDRLASSVGLAVEEESQYAQLYLRLAAALPLDLKLPEKLSEAAASQAISFVSTARLNAFVTLVLSSLVIMTVSLVRPILMAIVGSFSKLVSLEELRSWPIVWGSLGGSTKDVFRSLYLSLESLIAKGLTNFLENPLQFAFHLSIFGSLLVVSLLPKLEQNRTVKEEDDDDDDMALSSSESAEHLAKLGASSASRLSMLSDNGSIENALERWRATRSSSTEEIPGVAFSTLVRGFGYSLLSSIVTLAPIVVSFFAGGSSLGALSHIGLRWDSVLDVSVILLFVFFLVNTTMKDVMACTETRRVVQIFVSVLSKTLEEIQETNRHQADIQFMASVSPTAGLLVKDLWAAHTSKRAWAVRGANMHCKNGEILAILGDDGAGKTRMLTTIAESLISPPKRSRTSNKIRGYIAVGGVEGSKWDKRLLKCRLGVLLSDVRAVADTASLLSGWTLEEILEPVDGLMTADRSQKLSSNEKASIILSLKITGLYSTLIPKLPSKLSTVITVNEEDLRPSQLRPRSSVLSPAEWSKLLLAKVIAQTVYDNDNSLASTDKVENSLMGSVLLLDDPTVLLSEVEEAKLLKELRLTGAATIITTNKWATGRFADQIVVVKDGAIVESGAHSELIARGPQQSLYAAKWHAMTMQ